MRYGGTGGMSDLEFVFNLSSEEFKVQNVNLVFQHISKVK